MNNINITRRSASAFILGGVAHTFCQEAHSEEISKQTLTEIQFGDLKAPKERISFDPFEIQGMLSQSKATFRKRNSQFSDSLLESARSFVGVSRSANRPQVTEFLELFNLPFASNGSPIPFCAAGLAYASAVAYLKFWNEDTTDVNKLSLLRGALSELDRYHFYPSPSVVDIYNVALGKRRFADRTTTPKPGWLVIYDWEMNGGRNHVGIVESISKNALNTIEFNTSGQDNSNGGAVSRRQRAINKTIAGYVRTDIATFV